MDRLQELPSPGAATVAPCELSYHGAGTKSRGWETIAERTHLPVKSLSAPTSGGGPALPDDPTAATGLFYLVKTVLYHFAKNYWLKSV